MRFPATILTLMLLAGCADAATDAEKELAIVEKSGGTSAEICAARQKVADAYLKQHDAEKYRRAKVAADIQCQKAALDGG